MDKKLSMMNYMIIFILAFMLYILSIVKYITQKKDWVLFAFSLIIMFLSLWGALNTKIFMKKKAVIKEKTTETAPVKKASSSKKSSKKKPAVKKKTKKKKSKK